MGGGGWKRVALDSNQERFLQKITFCFAEKNSFLAHAKLSNKEKAFFSTQRHRLRTATTLTCSYDFYPRQPTVSLHYIIPFSYNNSLASALQPPFRTDSKPFRRRFADKSGFGRSRRKLLQTHFRQSFESSPESRGSQTSGVLPVLFVQAKSTKNVPFAGSSEVLQTSKQRTAVTSSHRTKANEQLQILSATTYCELAVKQLFFEKHQSCVCTTVTLSHRFKAFTPAFCGQNRFRHEPPENFAKLLPTEL